METAKVIRFFLKIKRNIVSYCGTKEVAHAFNGMD